ncbi:hypothetical protein Tco_1304945 [Tanacetum coccineum]
MSRKPQCINKSEMNSDARQEKRSICVKAVDAGMFVTERVDKARQADTSMSSGNYTTQAVESRYRTRGVRENEHLKQTYKELFDSIKKTKVQNKDNSESLISQINQKFVENADLKAQLQEKVFSNAALKNELRKIKGNSVDTKLAKASILGKPSLQPSRNHLVVRQPNAFKSERPRISRPRFASQVDEKNDLSKTVTPHYLPKVREICHSKPLQDSRKNVYRQNSGSLSKDMPTTRVHCTPKLSSAVHEKPNTPRSCLRWKPTGRIFKIAGLRWIPTGKMFTDNTTKVDREPLNGSNDDITNPYECDQTLNVSAGTLNLSAGLEKGKPSLRATEVAEAILSSHFQLIFRTKRCKSICLLQLKMKLLQENVHATMQELCLEPDPETRLQEDPRLDQSLENYCMSNLLSRRHGQSSTNHQHGSYNNHHISPEITHSLPFSYEWQDWSKRCLTVKKTAHSSDRSLASNQFRSSTDLIEEILALPGLRVFHQESRNLKKRRVAVKVKDHKRKHDRDDEEATMMMKALQLDQTRWEADVVSEHFDRDDNAGDDNEETKPDPEEIYNSGPGPQLLTPRTISSGLVPQPPSPTPNVPPTKNDWDLLFCPMLDEYFNPSTSTSQTTQEEQSHVIPTSVEEDDHGIEVAHMDNDL